MGSMLSAGILIALHRIVDTQSGFSSGNAITKATAVSSWVLID